MATLERLADAVQREGWPQPQRSLRRDGWVLERPEVLALVEKLHRSGVPLGKYVDGRFYRGVTTGLNKAFVIDQATRDQLISEDRRSAEIIKPWIRGRDIDRWRVDWPGLYLIFARRGIGIDRYPAVRHYLTQFKKRLMPSVPGGRKPGNYEWYEIQDTTDYYAEFEKPKIVYPDIAVEPEFAYDTTGAYGGNTMYILPTDELYLLGVLNSSVVEFFYNQISSTIRGDYLRFIATYMEQVPIPDAAPAQRAAIESLVRKLLDAEGQGPQVAEWEQELNALMYELYELTEEEVDVVEGVRTS
jgi:adenine-specific DNA-methyltransferase